MPIANIHTLTAACYPDPVAEGPHPPSHNAVSHKNRPSARTTGKQATRHPIACTHTHTTTNYHKQPHRHHAHTRPHINNAAFDSHARRLGRQGGHACRRTWIQQLDASSQQHFMQPASERTQQITSNLAATSNQSQTRAQGTNKQPQFHKRTYTNTYIQPQTHTHALGPYARSSGRQGGCRKKPHSEPTTGMQPALDGKR